jgi:hypothetical protein
MNTKIFGFLVILLIIAVIPVANAQSSTNEKAIQKSVEVKINSDGDVHVKHVVASSSLESKEMKLINGTVSNISVTNEEGKEGKFSVNEDSNKVVIFGSDGDSIIEYDLDNVLLQKDNVWTWSFRYLESTSFIFPEGVDLIFTNERPVYFNEKRGITCHGCQMILEYSINESKILKNVKWSDAEFTVEIRSHSNIDKFIFDQPTKSITFDVLEENKFVTIIIPLELLWKPYLVFLDDEKIFFHEYLNNGTHVWLNMKPDSSGKISIIGTTVIPEFPIIAPLAIGFLIVLAMPLMRKSNLH